MHRTVGIVSACLNCHMYILFVVVFWSLLLANSRLVAICLFVCSQQFIVAGYHYYYCLSDNQWQTWTKVEGGGGLSLSWLTGRDGQLLQTLYVNVQYLISRMLYLQSVHGSTTLASEWLNNLIFNDDIKCITTKNRQLP